VSVRSSAPEVVIGGRAGRGSFLTLAALGGLILLATLDALHGPRSPTVPAALATVGIAITIGRRLLAWKNLFLVLLLVILFIPIRRFTLSGAGGFQLEPYRAVAFAIIPLWIVALLIDQRVRLRGTKLDPQLLTIVLVTLASDVVNTGRINHLHVQSVVAKGLTFFLSFVVIYYFMTSVLGRRSDVDMVIKTLVTGGAILSFFALIEFNTRYDVFDHINKLLPILKVENTGYHSLEVRGGHMRVYGSGQHPIAYGAALLMLAPLGIYLARKTRERKWLVAAVLLILGSLATVSRTGILMGIVMLVIYLRLYPKQTKRLWPVLIPAVVVIHVALPGSLGTIFTSFFPSGGVIAQQSQGTGASGSGRLAHIGPSIAEWGRSPVFGEGYGSRVVDQGPLQNAPILDDQWLGTLLETGLLGVAAWIWFFVAFTRRMLKRARECLDTDDGWLYAALACGMLFYDAFSFIQTTFFAFIIAGLGATLLNLPAARPAQPSLRPEGRRIGPGGL
jgi:O-Antigen ligase